VSISGRIVLYDNYRDTQNCNRGEVLNGTPPDGSLFAIAVSVFLRDKATASRLIVPLALPRHR
jgi:hypothetical protein